MSSAHKNHGLLLLACLNCCLHYTTQILTLQYVRQGLIKIREAMEKRIILNVLEATQWNQTEAAKILKVNRNTLIQKAKQLGILLKRAD